MGMASVRPELTTRNVLEGLRCMGDKMAVVFYVYDENLDVIHENICV